MASHAAHRPAPAALDPALAPPPDDQNVALRDARATIWIVVIGVVLFVGSVFLFIF
jgi:uncharacterized membrane protein YgdD (TMEM256/DUF423 family)